ncbi:hypothetical protein A3D62_01765 [Candidatus Kaiserbacteria bacterium RIFCSPHIGHO2_02_FULL_49_11]|uniref:RNA polymerase subunit sigma-24 n=1 Tax=Candidatus Kaiserbacteria bacterium RIFCSPHIGHO2_02_FULL_49_11 TaxID=1798489 RepID=A0A1F6D1M1_9BACT|nr:MAG: hypothetical protein A3D62_01765 [Candidatus Kaiserbacteria bacterium RIFCSPHIGHO2_02_FULL_49_11]
MGLLDYQTEEESGATQSDEEILALSLHNPDLFSLILKRYQDAFMRKALSILKNNEDAEEAVSETFSKIYLYADRFEVQDGAHFSSWAYRILMNTCFTRYQKLKKDWAALQTLDPEVYEALPDTGEQFEKHTVSDYVVSALAKMPEHFARVLSLHFIEGLSHQEIAEKEGLSLGAVKTRVHRAKESFRKVTQSSPL